MNIKAEAFQKEGLISILQFSADQKDTLDYLSLNAALKKNLIEITERERASVNNLVVNNNADKPVFIMDGDVLEGAKQNRVVNASALITANGKVELPVSCVEKNRWNYRGRKFGSANYTAPTRLRFSKSQAVRENLRRSSKYYASQGKVWDDVSNYHKEYNIKSDTQDLSDLFKKDSNKTEDSVKQFLPHEESNGLAVFIGNKLLNLEVFNRSEVYLEYFPKIIKGSLFETLNLQKKENKTTEAEAKYKTIELLDKLESAKAEIYPSISLGFDVRYDLEDISASALCIQDKFVHLSALNLN